MKPSRNGSKTTAATSKDSHKIFLIGVKNPLPYKLYSESHAGDSEKSNMRKNFIYSQKSA
jgi:hypothetical protein